MNIKELAKQAGIGFNDGSDLHTTIKRFAELVAAAERQASAKRYHEIMHDVVTEAVAKEREACATVCEEVGRQTAAAIRARGDKHD